MSLDAIYASHPVSERNILARLRRQNIPLTGLDEWTLAIDPDTDISDQNHSGGVQSVLALAIAARISASSTVVDIGAGIGGSARVLAQAFGCSVVAVERDSERCQQAIRLTALVGLSDRVRFLEHDALVNTPDIENADALWGQSAWAHFSRSGSVSRSMASPAQARRARRDVGCVPSERTGRTGRSTHP